jgi:hypothetical protein
VVCGCDCVQAVTSQMFVELRARCWLMYTVYLVLQPLNYCIILKTCKMLFVIPRLILLSKSYLMFMFFNCMYPVVVCPDVAVYVCSNIVTIVCGAKDLYFRDWIVSVWLLFIWVLFCCLICLKFFYEIDMWSYFLVLCVMDMGGEAAYVFIILTFY